MVNNYLQFLSCPNIQASRISQHEINIHMGQIINDKIPYTHGTSKKKQKLRSLFLYRETPWISVSRILPGKITSTLNDKLTRKTINYFISRHWSTLFTISSAPTLTKNMWKKHKSLLSFGPCKETLILNRNVEIENEDNKDNDVSSNEAIKQCTDQLQ